MDPADEMWLVSIHPRMPQTSQTGFGKLKCFAVPFVLAKALVETTWVTRKCLRKSCAPVCRFGLQALGPKVSGRGWTPGGTTPAKAWGLRQHGMLRRFVRHGGFQMER